MNKNIKTKEEMQKVWDAYRRIIFVEKSEKEENTYSCHVINTNGASVCPTLSCSEEEVKVLSLVFSTDICNFQVVDGKLQFGWPIKALDALSELVRNIHEKEQIPEQEEYPEYEPMPEEDDEECWDADIPDEERIINPSSRTINLSYLVGRKASAGK